jgi:thiol-disulfide isomerase/thioredoxin
MKKIFFLLIITAFSAAANAQTTAVIRHRVDENSIVKDSSGMNYPYVVWQKLISTGNYTLRAIDPRSDSTAYLIVQLSEKERDAMLSRLPKPSENKFFTDGEKLELFNTKDINGNKLKLKDMAGKVIVLNFWFIGCPPCGMEIPELNKIALEYASNPNVIFVAVCLDEDYQIIDFTKNNPFSYHIIDHGQYYADQYKINLYPTNVVLDKDGKVRFHASGYSSGIPYWIKKTIDEALQ